MILNLKQENRKLEITTEHLDIELMHRLIKLFNRMIVDHSKSRLEAFVYPPVENPIIEKVKASPKT
jgi:hypothetical protein